MTIDYRRGIEAAIAAVRAERSRVKLAGISYNGTLNARMEALEYAVEAIEMIPGFHPRRPPDRRRAEARRAAQLDAIAEQMRLDNRWVANKRAAALKDWAKRKGSISTGLSPGKSS
jgi:hypothetical protein